MPNRPMTTALRTALAALTPFQRKFLRAAASEQSPDDVVLGPLLVALAAEVSELDRHETIDRMKEATILHELEADHHAEIAELTSWLPDPDPPSEATGAKPWWPQMPDADAPFSGDEA